jgi:hypothetical protein
MARSTRARPERLKAVPWRRDIEGLDYLNKKICHTLGGSRAFLLKECA